MVHDSPDDDSGVDISSWRRDRQRRVQVLVWIGLALMFAVTVYLNQPAVDGPAPLPPPPAAPQRMPGPDDDRVPLDEPAPNRPAPQHSEDDGAQAVKPQTRFDNLVLRDADGRVVFRGTVDLAPTLDRIARGERLRFSHDGSPFENRERRLPRQPSGYYREYVQPTPGQTGPGPQRIIVGRDGEVYYTFDHYRTFRRVQ